MTRLAVLDEDHIDVVERHEREVAAYAEGCIDGGLTYADVAALLRDFGHDYTGADIEALCVRAWADDAAEWGVH